MPPRICPPRSLAQPGSSRAVGIAFCPSCSIWRLAAPTRQARSFLALRNGRAGEARQLHPPALSSSSSGLINSRDSGSSFTRRTTAEQWTGHSRQASVLASPTSINAPLDIPPNLRELHTSLKQLEHTAANYINLSRLQLAVRGLEGHDAVVRIAVLAIGDQTAARQLVRLLLADPLGEKEAWEKELESGGDGRAVLIR
ncbi:hypothetical protein LTS18_013452, partial [Coniosporium uncinatum]